MSEHPSVTQIETILDGAATRLVAGAPRSTAPLALWICPCVTMADAPTWLIYEDEGGGLVWVRLPDGHEPSDVVDARLIAGGHTDPAVVLDWLQGTAPDPWSSGGSGDEDVLDGLVRRVRRAVAQAGQ